MTKRLAKIVVTLVASGVIIALVVYFVGVRDTLAALGHAGVAAFLTVGVLLAGLLCLQAAAWGGLERAIGHRIPFRTLVEATVIAHAGNILTPSTYLGGEPARVIYAARKAHLPYQALAGTVLLAKYLELLSFVLFLGAGTVAAAVGFSRVLFRPPHVGLGVAVVGVAAATWGLCVLLWASLRRGWTPLAGVVGLLGRLPVWRGFFARLAQRTVEVEHEAARVFREEGHAVRPAFWIFLLTHATIFVKPLAFFYFGWRMNLDLADLSLIFLTCQILLAFQLVPSGAGTLDGGLLAMLAVTGIAITQPQCAAFLLCIRFWDAAMVGAGALLAARMGMGLFRGGDAAK
jgi:uncharacterized membrane protein YbhN (UPF0104 family)